jgi:hypothetical protein
MLGDAREQQGQQIQQSGSRGTPAHPVRDNAAFASQESLMPHIALLGDSVFDNIAYTLGAPDVVAQLTAALPAGWRASLSAVDGSTATDIERQLVSLPAGVSHLVLSVGGNNALLVADILDTPVASTAEAFRLMAEVREKFEEEYSSAVDACLRLGLPLTVCTIYHGNFPEADFNRRARIALAVFNDVIVQTALARSLDVIDLRAVCTVPADFANPIEPSAIGGEKIARTVARTVAQQGTWRGARMTGAS